MAAFYDRKLDLLVTTNIIESGLDIPTANTLIIHRADRFGLSQLYQLRGRIGRGKVRGYAYFTLPPNQALRETAERRLQVIQALDQLGAGFQLASHDLDIRGAGNLLGDEQSGHIREVGFELYNHMLEEAVALARQEGGEALAEAEDWTPQLSIDAAALIPDGYIEDLDLRLSVYRRLAALERGRGHRGVRRRADRPLRAAAGADRAAAAAGRHQAAVPQGRGGEGGGGAEGRAGGLPRQQVRQARAPGRLHRRACERRSGCAPTTVS